MVTWGVTDRGGRTVASNSVDEDDAATVTSPTRHARSDASDSLDAASGEWVVPDDPDVPPITVAPTGQGLARAVAAASAALATTGPRRSHPAYRSRPPAMTVGERTRVPDVLATRRPDVDVAIELPPTLQSVFVAAPLAYYLQADVRTREECRPRLLVGGDSRLVFEDLAGDAARVLRRVFHLDCLSRRGPGASERRHQPVGDGLLDSLDLDPDSLRSMSAASRLDRYLDAWEPRFDDELPEWHLSTAVEPTLASISSLPALLERLSLITRPDGEPARHTELLERTLGDAYRTRGGSCGADVVAPRGRSARTQGWLAPGKPIEAFKSTTTAFTHRRRYRTSSIADRRIAVVLGDGRMRSEFDDVAEAYRAAASTTVDVVRSPTRATLRAVLQSGVDLLHYVGHCDDAGLRCTDGHLAAEDVAPCRTPAFVLNACGSYDEGLALVERGAVAGAVTYTDVLDRHAARVGTALARLLVDGFSVQRALQIARRQILMGQDYAAVGDGTYAPWSSERPPGILWIERLTADDLAETAAEVSFDGSEQPTSADGASSGDDSGEGTLEPPETYEVTYEAVSIRQTGDRHPVPFDDRTIFNGDAITRTIARGDLVAALEGGSYPVVWDEDLFWSDEITDCFRPPP